MLFRKRTLLFAVLIFLTTTALAQSVSTFWSQSQYSTCSVNCHIQEYESGATTSSVPTSSPHNAGSVLSSGDWAGIGVIVAIATLIIAIVGLWYARKQYKISKGQM
jgi:ABC-type antimicrobial peptide transport system permease subunit